MSTAGKVCIVTGGASGVGKATAKMLARQGAKVVVADISVELGERTLAEIVNEGGIARFFAVDVSNHAQVEDMITSVRRELGPVWLLCNNAAATGLTNLEDRRVHEIPESVWDGIHDVSLKGTFLCSKASIPDMIANGGGCIINVSSVDALVGQGGYDAYSAAKGGIVSLTRSMAVGYADDGIRVNCVCPGFVNTELQSDWLASDESRRTIESMHLTRIAEAEDIARFICFLANDGYVTGGIYPVDGGFTAFKTKVTSYEAESKR